MLGRAEVVVVLAEMLVVVEGLRWEVVDVGACLVNWVDMETGIVEKGGSSGFSIGGTSSSECRPTVLSGRRIVPLFGRGSICSESQRIL